MSKPVKAILWVIGMWYVGQALLSHWEQQRDKQRKPGPSPIGVK